MEYQEGQCDSQAADDCVYKSHPLDEMLRARAALDHTLSSFNQMPVLLHEDNEAATVSQCAESPSCTIDRPRDTQLAPHMGLTKPLSRRSRVLSNSLARGAESLNRLLLHRLTSSLQSGNFPEFWSQLQDPIVQTASNLPPAASLELTVRNDGLTAGKPPRWTNELALCLVDVLLEDQLRLLQAQCGETWNPSAGLAEAMEDLEATAQGASGLIVQCEDLDGQASSTISNSGRHMIRQLSTAIRRIDRVLPLKHAEAHAQTLVQAIHLALKSGPDIISAVLGSAFDSALRIQTSQPGEQDQRQPAAGESISKSRPQHVRLRLGWKHWRPQRFELGSEIEIYRDMQLGMSNVVDRGGKQAHLRSVCSVRHALPLVINSAAKDAALLPPAAAAEVQDEFVDAAASGEHSDRPNGCGLFDLRFSSVTMRVRVPKSTSQVPTDDQHSGVQGQLEKPRTSEDADEKPRPDASKDEVEDEAKGGQGYEEAAAELLTQSRPLVAQLYGWGDNQCASLGLSQGSIQPDPQLIPLSLSLPILERITQVASSSRHSLILTALGAVYTCGDGTDGALGHGDLLSAARFRLIEVLTSAAPPVCIRYVAAGADILGTHSAAVDTQGRIWTWGFGPATGHNLSKPVQTPRKIDPELLQREKVKGVACGGAFTLTATEQGKVYSWGLWAHGRLGLGRPASTADRYGRQKLQKYKLTPMQIKGALQGRWVDQIAAGLGHSLALTSQGEVWAWGRDDLGQLGMQHPATGKAFASRFEPEKVDCFRDGVGYKVVEIACGLFHSLVVDGAGGVWSWGGGGGACLGHGDVIDSERRPETDFRALVRRQSVASDIAGQAVMAKRPLWGVPRRIQALKGLLIQSISAGSHHSAAIDEERRLWMWGESVSTLRSPPQGGEMYVQGVEIPRQPCEAWLPELEGQWVEAVFCGGQNTFLLTAGERTGMVMGSKLWNSTSRKFKEEDNWSALSGHSQLSGFGRGEAQRAAMGEASDMPGETDTLLLVGGRVLYAHKVIISRRSQIFREMLAAEEYPGKGNSTQLLLPGLRYDVCRALLQFIYTDNLSSPLDIRTSLPQELLVAAQTYKLPRLESICQMAITQATTTSTAYPTSPDMHLLPHSTLLADFSSCLFTYPASPNWADIRFCAKGRPLLAHRFVLTSVSSYFRGLLRPKAKQGQGGNQLGWRGRTIKSKGRLDGIVEIVVPDDYDCMRRVLLYMYSGSILADSTRQVVELLIAADRYRLEELKVLCESLVEIRVDDCLDLLVVADLYDAARLREATLTFAVRQLDQVVRSVAFTSFVKEYPHLLDALFDKIKAHSPHSHGVSAQEEEAEVAAEEKQGANKGQEEDGKLKFIFPWRAVAVLAIAGVLYRELARAVSFGMIVPMLNGSCLVGVVIYASIKGLN